MYVEGISDLMQMILTFPFSPPDAKEKNLESIKERATNRYFPVFEKVRDSKYVSIKLAIIQQVSAKQECVCSVGQFPVLSFFGYLKEGEIQQHIFFFVGLCCQGYHI